MIETVMQPKRTMYRASATPPLRATPLSRRAWLSAAGCVALLPWIASTRRVAAEAPRPAGFKNRYRLGCSGRCFHRLLPTKDRPGAMSLADFMSRAAQWNCDCVELLNTNLIDTSPATLAGIKRSAFLAGVELSAVTLYTDWIKPDAADMRAETDRIRPWIEHAAALGAPLLVVFPGARKRDMPMDRAVDLVAEGIGRVIDHAARHGVLLGLENHGMFNDDAEAVLKVVDKVDHPWLGVNLDTGNFRRSPYEGIALLAPKAINCHVKLEVNDNGQRQPADLPKTFDFLRQANYRGRVTLQYELKGDPLTDVPKYLEQMSALAAKRN